MSIKDKVVNLVIRGRDLLSAPMKESADATKAAAKEIDEINGSLKSLKEQAGQVAKARALEIFGDGLKEKLDAAQVALEETQKEMAATAQPSEELQAAFKGATEAANKLQSEHKRVNTELNRINRTLTAAGVDMGKLAEEENRLAGRTKALTVELKTLEQAQESALKTGELQARTKIAQEEYQKTTERVKTLAAAFDASKVKTKAARTELSLAQSEANRASTAYQKVNRELKSHEEILKGAGVEAKNMGTAEQELGKRLVGVRQELAELGRQQKEVSRASDLTPYLEDLSHGLKESEAHLSELNRELKAVQTPSKKLNDELGKAAQAAGRAQIAYERNKAALTQLREQMSGAGLNTADLVQQQKELAEKLVSSGQALAEKKRELKGMGRETVETTSKVGDFNRAVTETTKRLLGWAAAYVGLQKIQQGLMGIINTGGQFETLREQLIGVYGDVAQGEQAFEWAVKLNERLPTSLQDVLQAFVMLRNNGMEPMDGTLESLINANARYGKGAETLIPIIRQLTQSWGKNRLQAEEAYVLIENGLPVWNLLAEATGRNVAELQKMSEQGRLTRSYLQDLIDTMGKAGAGVVERRMHTWQVMMTKFRDRIQQVQDQIAQSGALDYFKDQLDAVLKSISAMAEDGRLAKFTKEFSDGMVKAAKATKAFLSWIWESREGLVDLAKIAVAAKLAPIFLGWFRAADKLGNVVLSLVGSLGKVGPASKAGMATATAAMVPVASGLTNLIRLTNIWLARLALTPVGAVLAVGAALVYATKKLGEWSGEQIRATGQNKAWLKTQEEHKKQLAELSDQLGITIDSWDHYRQLMDSGKIKYDDMNDEMVRAEELLRRQRLATGELGHELQSSLLPTLDRLGEMDGIAKGVDEFVKAAGMGPTIFDQLNLATGITVKQLKEMAKEGQLTPEFIRQTAAAVQQMLSIAPDIGTVLTPEIQKMVEVLERAKQEGQGAGHAIGNLLKEFDPGDSGSTEKVEQLSLALKAARDQAIYTRDELKTGLREQLKGMAGSDLRNFQVNWTALYGHIAEEAPLLADTMNASLGAAFDKLGTSLEEVRGGVTLTGEDMVQTFMAVSENANATSAEVFKAFDHALLMAKTKGDVDALTLSMQAWAHANGVAGDEVEKHLKKADAHLTKLNDAYRELGIVSAKVLQQTAVDARAAFVELEKQGAPLHDMKQAFFAYAEAELAAAKAGDRQVSAHLKSKAAALGLTAELDKLIAKQNELKAATDNTTASTNRQADALNAAGDATDNKDAKQSRSIRVTEGFASASDAASMSVSELTDKLAENANMQVRVNAMTGQYAYLVRDNMMVGLKAAEQNMQQTLRAKQLMEEMNATAAPSQALIASAEAAAQSMDRLDKSTLSSLNSAIDGAKGKLQSLEDTAQSTLRSLQDELDQMYGKTDEVERRRYETQMAQLKGQLADAEAAGNAEASAQLRESIALAQTLHKEKMGNINKEKAEKAKQEKEARDKERQAAAGARPGQSEQVTTLRLEAPDGSQSELKGSPNDVNNTLAALKQAGLVVSRF